jgi:hypothetical protein
VIAKAWVSRAGPLTSAASSRVDRLDAVRPWRRRRRAITSIPWVGSMARIRTQPGLPGDPAIAFRQSWSPYALNTYAMPPGP